MDIIILLIVVCYMYSSVYGFCTLPEVWTFYRNREFHSIGLFALTSQLRQAQKKHEEGHFTVTLTISEICGLLYFRRFLQLYVFAMCVNYPFLSLFRF